jgi:NADPH-dependent 2,4-dienoyl-CoA reductase/sulfur reductase-like enzyme
MGTPLGLNVPAAAAVKQVVDVPVMVVGRINDPLLAEDILQKRRADMTVMGRALLADPELPNKAAEGRLEDIVPCASCGLGCVGEQMKMKSMSCVINPTVGREKETTLVPAATRKKVLIAGGGPGGLEAARVAALRGHEVTLYEKGAKLGGQLNAAAMAPTKQEIARWIQYLAAQVEKAGVRVELNQEVTAQLIEEQKPDVVVIATGGELRLPPIAGLDREKVIDGSDVLEGKVNPRRAKVLVIGGGSTGCEVADAIAGHGDNPLDADSAVTIVEMLPGLALDAVPATRMLLLQRLRERGVESITSATVKEIGDAGAVIERDGREETIAGIDHIVIACGTEAVDHLSAKIREKVPEVHVIGQAREECRALEAISQGAEVGRAI